MFAHILYLLKNKLYVKILYYAMPIYSKNSFENQIY